MWRARPALPRFWFSWSRLLTWPIVAMHLMLTRRTSPDGSRIWACVALLGEELGRDAGGPDDLAALAGDELDVVDRRAERDLGDRQGVADPRLGIRPGDDDVADLQAVRQEHVALLAVAVEEQADPGRPVRVVLDRRQREPARRSCRA